MNKTLQSAGDTKVVTFRLSESELNNLDALAKKESRSRSSLLVLLVKLAIGLGREEHTPIFFTNNYSRTKFDFVEEIKVQEPHEN